jgi:hypothetical protein
MKKELKNLILQFRKIPKTNYPCIYLKGSHCDLAINIKLAHNLCPFSKLHNPSRINGLKIA